MAGGIIKSNRTLGRRGSSPMSEINVTPFVDVMLVLLIIFMVTAPLMTVGVPVDLPKAKASAINENIEPLTISMTCEGKVFLQETEVPLEGLIAKLQAITDAKPDTRIFVRGDQSVTYGQIMAVVGAVNSAGFKKVALMTEMPSADKVKETSKKNR